MAFLLLHNYTDFIGSLLVTGRDSWLVALPYAGR